MPGAVKPIRAPFEVYARSATLMLVRWHLDAKVQVSILAKPMCGGGNYVAATKLQVLCFYLYLSLSLKHGYLTDKDSQGLVQEEMITPESLIGKSRARVAPFNQSFETATYSPKYGTKGPATNDGSVVISSYPIRS